MEKGLGRWAVGIGVALALAIGVLAGSMFTAGPEYVRLAGATVIPVQVTASRPVAAAALSFENGFSAVVSSVVPSVVNIASSKVVTTGREMRPFEDPLFREFFGDYFRLPPRERRESSLGSGVIISPEGYILTNNHVVAGATDITVTLSDNRDFKARLIGTDPQTDIAVIKVDARQLPVAVLGDSSRVRVGEFALAIGSPFGLSQTVTMGIISATGRGNLGIEEYEDFIQTDTAINPGNSGGALVNVRGELVGINTAIVSGASGNQGVGFAIPINMAREVMSQILKRGRVIRGYLGAWVQPVTPEIARAFKLPRATGALLGDVEPGSPAVRSGLRRGDVIVALNGEPVTDSQAFRMKIAMTPPGTRIRLRVVQDGVERNVDVVLGELPAKAQEEPQAQARAEQRSQPLQGFSVTNLTPGLARQIGVPPQTRGVVVTNVEPGSTAEEAGLQRGDVIQEVNRQPVASVEEFRRASASGSGLLLVNRGGTTLYLVLR